MIPELLLHCSFSLFPPLCLTRDSYSPCGNVWKTKRRFTKAISFPVPPLLLPRHALLIPARTSAAHLPAQAIYAQANRQSLPEQALSLRLSVSFCSIPTKLNFKARGGCQPLDHYVVLPHTPLFPALRLRLPHRNPQTSCWCQQILFICGSCCITTF